MYKELIKFSQITKEFKSFHKKSLPLCAAETVISDFVKAPLAEDFQERYIMGSAYEFSMENNFIGSEYLLPYYKMIDQLGKEIFHAKYTDVRTLTGMNAANVLISSLCKPNDNIMILGKEWGGHASMKPTFERLGANVFDAPYDLEKHDFNYAQLNKDIKEKNITFINIAPSDILFPHDFSQIDDRHCTVLFDYSQLLGLIGANLLANPLDYLENSVLYGGTHKTMPGPAHGIIMTNNDKIYNILDKEINPKYLRNIQTHQVISVLLTLIEMKYFGKDYQKNTVRIGNFLGKKLEEFGIPVVNKNGVYTYTHQLFLEMSETDMLTFFNNAIKEGVTLNTKKKPLFRGGFGIRLGLQEISRYAWDDEAIIKVAKILSLISKPKYNSSLVKDMIRSLPDKKVHFSFSTHQYAHLFD